MGVPPSILRSHARQIWRAGLGAADPVRLLGSFLHIEGEFLVLGRRRLALAEFDSIVVVGAGKAGGRMSEGVERILGPRVLRAKRVRGWVNIPDCAVRPLRAIHLHGARRGHANQPTRQGVAGARRIASIVKGVGRRDLCLCLLSGGGSALLPAPAAGIALADKRRVTGLLHSAGAPIDEVNTVRKHLSMVKGGGLLREWGGQWLTAFVLSDVPDDRMDVIASGPTTPDPTTFADAIDVLRRHRLWDIAPEPVRTHLAEGAAGRRQETLKILPPGVDNILIGRNRNAIEGAAHRARTLGYRVVEVTLEGEASEAGRRAARIAREMRGVRTASSQPICLIAGGETTVRLVRRVGKGGRCQEMALAGLVDLGDDARGIVMLSAGTDGEDGPTDAAGAMVSADISRRAAQLGLDPGAFLTRHDSYSFFEQVDGLHMTGLTGTNVMDLAVVLVDAAH